MLPICPSGCVVQYIHQEQVSYRTYLGQPFALLLDVLVLIEIDQVHNWLPTDARIAVEPVCLLHIPITKPA